MPRPLHALCLPPEPGARAVLFLHGAGADHTVWGNQIAELRGRTDLVALDLPGHGRSAPPGERTIEAYAAAVRGFIADRRLERPVLVGHSMGGGIGLRIALDDPGALGGLALVGSGAKLGVAPRILEMLERDHEAAVTAITGFAYADDAPDEMVRDGRKWLLRCPPGVLLDDFRACNGFDVRPEVESLRLPVLVLCGTKDRLTFPRFSEWLADRIPSARLRLIPGAGHLVMIERPSEVSAALVEFLASLPAGREG